MGHEVVRVKYEDFLTPHDFTEGNQLEAYEIVSNQVKALLKGGTFLQHGHDENNRTNNLAHPGLKDLCIQFFYAGDHALGRTFPDDFKDEVPEHPVALAMTCIQLCLEEWEDGLQRKLSFKGEVYGAVHNAMLDLIKEVKNNPYHGPKFAANHRKWARTGMRIINGPATKTHRDLGLWVVLD